MPTPAPAQEGAEETTFQKFARVAQVRRWPQASQPSLTTISLNAAANIIRLLTQRCRCAKFHISSS